MRGIDLGLLRHRAPFLGDRLGQRLRRHDQHRLGRRAHRPAVEQHAEAAVAGVDRRLLVEALHWRKALHAEGEREKALNRPGGAAAGFPALDGWNGRAPALGFGIWARRPGRMPSTRGAMMAQALATFGCRAIWPKVPTRTRHGPCADQQAAQAADSSAPAAGRPVPPLRRNGVASGTPCASRASGATMNSQPSLRSER